MEASYQVGQIMVQYAEDPIEVQELGAHHYPALVSKIENRPLQPNPADPTDGSDVRMLETVLWQLGVSPSAQPGIVGQRLAQADRNTLDTGNNSIGKMLRRFNYFSHSPINRLSASPQRFMTANVNGIEYSTLEDIKNHWQHYIAAYADSQLGRYHLNNLLQTDLDAAEAVFDGQVTYPRGPNLGTIDPTYTTAVHNDLQRYGTFARTDILKAMAMQESGGWQWGYRNNADDKFRVTVGGADEAGSSGFNQIQNKYTYGGLASDGTDRNGNTCTEVSAYSQTGDSQVNHYDPGQNLTAKAVWPAAPGGTGRHRAAPGGNCGRSFRSAFRNLPTSSYRGTYRSQAGVTLLRMITGPENEQVTGGQHRDDYYELLAKGLGGYNQGMGTFSGGNDSAWVNLLTTQAGPTSAEYRRIAAIPYRRRTEAEKASYRRTTAMQYAMNIMHDANKLGLPLRRYIWRGGVYPVGHPRAGQDWCFAYGEREWRNGDVWSDVRLNASDTDAFGNPQTPVGRINCTTGAPIP